MVRPSIKNEGVRFCRWESAGAGAAEGRGRGAGAGRGRAQEAPTVLLVFSDFRTFLVDYLFSELFVESHFRQNPMSLEDT